MKFFFLNLSNCKEAKKLVAEMDSQLEEHPDILTNQSKLYTFLVDFLTKKGHKDKTVHDRLYWHFYAETAVKKLKDRKPKPKKAKRVRPQFKRNRRREMYRGDAEARSRGYKIDPGVDDPYKRTRIAEIMEQNRRTANQGTHASPEVVPQVILSEQSSLQQTHKQPVQQYILNAAANRTYPLAYQNARRQLETLYQSTGRLDTDPRPFEWQSFEMICDSHNLHGKERDDFLTHLKKSKVWRDRIEAAKKAKQERVREKREVVDTRFINNISSDLRAKFKIPRKQDDVVNRKLDEATGNA